MFNWNTDEKKLKKDHPKEYQIWRIAQLINYGLGNEKLDRSLVIKVWPKLKDRLAPDKRKTLEWLLWDKKWHREPSLLPNRSNYWSLSCGNRTS